MYKQKDSYLPHPSRKSKTIKIIDFKIKNENKQSVILVKITTMKKMHRQALLLGFIATKSRINRFKIYDAFDESSEFKDTAKSAI